MKRIVAIFLLSLVTSTLMAQPPRQGGNKADFKMLQTEIITKQLKLDADKESKFIELYIEYTKKMEEFNTHPPRRGGGEKGGAKRVTRPQPSDEEIEAQILRSFEMAEKSTTLKREYYPRFKEILTPRQIMTMYNTERQIRERIVSEARRREEKKD